ncbi:acyltransferase family protein [Vogesella sp. LIG4]|uniref:acyltransferase family protein n=1 Tax=Vogesella sp. LIG4 TaxID=1192162 RepID=UPI00081FEE0E|nr:acyltransferase family protein [Vogesella sp. LIG4]SCK10636.1 Peptidoglycan/LPS O-acetylase OafA/YrhL, contains acyltransferase and SGNH-hydrolase domains [Vogesella sp. LIG4]
MLAFPRPSASPAYRADIDGLRAIAVLAVIAYHIGVPGLAGGFVGVDIFFVISGYLISGLLQQELLQHGKVRFAAFFSRRIRRLGPALALVTLCTLLAGYVLLLPDDANSLGREARAVVTLYANHHFLDHAFDYFNAATDLKPLLHTWSLAVEEQYYLVWPLLMLAAWRWGRGSLRVVRAVLALVLLSSFLLCLYLSWHNMPMAFYLMPTRAWEFAAGGLLALAPATRWRSEGAMALLLGLAGAVLTFGSILLFDEHRMVFPGWAAMLPVAGSLLLIAAGELSPHNLVSRLLSARLMTALGLLSYSWYLWHQPLLALGRSYGVGERDLTRDLLLGGGLSLLLAWLTYCLLEQPVRQRRLAVFVADKSTLWAGLAMSLTVWVGGTVDMYLPARHPWPGQQELMRMKADGPSLPPNCGMAKNGVPLAPAASCRGGAANVPLRLLAWGDSHSDHSWPMYQALAEARGVAMLRRVYHGCPPLPDAVPVGEGKVRSWCLNHSRAVLQEAGQLAGQGLSGVLMNVRWNGYTALPVPGSLAITGLAAVSADGRVDAAGAMLAGSGTLDRQHSLQVMQTALDKLAGDLERMKLKLVLLAPEPEFRLPVPECLVRRGAAACNVSRAEVDAQRRDIVAILQQVAARHSNVRVWDDIGRFCDATTCYAADGKVPRFGDRNHMLATMSRSLAGDFAATFDWASQRSSQ